MALITQSVWDTPTFAGQAVRDPVDDIVLAYLGQQTGIVTPTTGVVSPGAGYTINVAAHTISWQGTEQAVTALTNFSTGLAAQSTSDRKDLIQVSSTGTVSIVTGQPCGYTVGNWFEGCGFNAPVTPRPSANCQPLASLYVEGTYATVSTFTTAMITDKSGIWISPTNTTQGKTEIEGTSLSLFAPPTTSLGMGLEKTAGQGAGTIASDGAIIDQTGAWINETASISWISATSFSVVGDVHLSYLGGSVLKWQDGGGQKYGIIAADSTFGSGITTVVLIVNTSYSMANSLVGGTFFYSHGVPNDFPGSLVLAFVTGTNVSGFTGALTVGAGSIAPLGGRRLRFGFFIIGTSANANFAITTPFVAAGSVENIASCTVEDSGTAGPGNCFFASLPNSSTLNINKAMNFVTQGFTSTGTKGAMGYIDAQV